MFFCDPEDEIFTSLIEEKEGNKKKEEKEKNQTTKGIEERIYFEKFVSLLKRGELYKTPFKFTKVNNLEKIDNFCFNSTHAFFAFSSGNIKSYKIEDFLNSNFNSPVWDIEGKIINLF
jgi:hypothetical protein